MVDGHYNLLRNENHSRNERDGRLAKSYRELIEKGDEGPLHFLTVVDEPTCHSLKYGPIDATLLGIYAILLL